MRLLPDTIIHNAKYIPHKYRIAVIQTNPNCELCNKSAIEVHHKDRNKHNNCFNNLMAVCHKCHHELHSGLEYRRSRLSQLKSDLKYLKYFSDKINYSSKRRKEEKAFGL